MLNIGCHLSIHDGLIAMAQCALSINAKTMQFFAGNPRGSSMPKKEGIDEFKTILKIHNFAPLVIHAPYVINFCSNNNQIRINSEKVVKREIEWLNQIPGNYYNIHPGCHVGNGIKRGIELISESVQKVLSSCENTVLLLETMSGKGSEVGSKFEELAEIIDNVNGSDKIGICLDTCHVFSAGYDIVNKLDEVLSDFDKIIGIQHLKAIHLNDSMTGFASRKDRHERIGYGTIGLSAIKHITQHKFLKHLPFILETPNDISGYKEEIRTLSEKNNN